MFRKYFKPKSITWWSALGLIGYGIVTHDLQSVLAGLAGIGVRGAISGPED